jgi:hypothetical protein
MELGGKSYWSSTFHTYGLYVGLDDTVYYFDDIEVLRHPTGSVSSRYPHFFMIKKYDVYVYLGADADQGSGSVTISSLSGRVDANGTYFYWKRWLDGLFVVSEATRLERPSRPTASSSKRTRPRNSTSSGPETSKMAGPASAVCRLS